MSTHLFVEHFQTLARYNTIVNQRLYAVCATLSDTEYRKERFGSFGSIHRTLNHILLGDRIWMERFEGGETHTPSLSTILYEDFGSLRAAREEEDGRIERFMNALTEEQLTRTVRYVNSAGIAFADSAPLTMAHMFNHQTHHRGQVHTMLSHAGVQPPSLDMHRAIKPQAATA